MVADVVADVTDWELYEGCLVTLENQTAVSGVNNYGEIDLSAGIPMDNLFFNFDADYGAEFGSVTGVISYGFEQFKINPVPKATLSAMCLMKVLRAPLKSSKAITKRTVTVKVVAVTDLVSDHGFKMQVAANGAACMSMLDHGSKPL